MYALAVVAWPVSMSAFSTTSWTSSTPGTYSGLNLSFSILIARSAMRPASSWSLPPTDWAALNTASITLSLLKSTTDPSRFLTFVIVILPPIGGEFPHQEECTIPPIEHHTFLHNLYKGVQKRRKMVDTSLYLY